MSDNYIVKSKNILDEKGEKVASVVLRRYNTLSEIERDVSCRPIDFNDRILLAESQEPSSARVQCLFYAFKELFEKLRNKKRN